MTPKRIVLATFGSLGDLFPYLAVGLGLRARGHDPIVATSARYRERVERLGLGFAPVRPDVPDPLADPAYVARVMDPRTGADEVFRKTVIPVLRETYADTLAAAAGADLLVSHLLTMTVRLVSERTGIPWVSSVLQPLALFSAVEPPVLAPIPWLARLRFLGPAFHRALYAGMRWSLDRWVGPWHRLRAGRPMLVMPYGHDQPDNAVRIVRLGVGRALARRAYRVDRVVAELRRLLGEASYAERADALGRRVRAEDGVGAACDAIGGVLAGTTVAPPVAAVVPLG